MIGIFYHRIQYLTQIEGFFKDVNEQFKCSNVKYRFMTFSEEWFDLKVLYISYNKRKYTQAATSGGLMEQDAAKNIMKYNILRQTFKITKLNIYLIGFSTTIEGVPRCK